MTDLATALEDILWTNRHANPLGVPATRHQSQQIITYLRDHLPDHAEELGLAEEETFDFNFGDQTRYVTEWRTESV